MQVAVKLDKPEAEFNRTHSVIMCKAACNVCSRDNVVGIYVDSSDGEYGATFLCTFCMKEMINTLEHSAKDFYT